MAMEDGKTNADLKFIANQIYPRTHLEYLARGPIEKVPFSLACLIQVMEALSFEFRHEKRSGEREHARVGLFDGAPGRSTDEESLHPTPFRVGDSNPNADFEKTQGNPRFTRELSRYEHWKPEQVQ